MLADGTKSTDIEPKKRRSRKGKSEKKGTKRRSSKGRMAKKTPSEEEAVDEDSEQ